MSSAAIVSLRIKTTPAKAFACFTEEIGQWWRPSALFQLTPRGDGALRFEGGATGRLVTTLANGKEFEIGQVTAWAPGERLAFTWRQANFAPDQNTSVEVTFKAVGDETRVTITHCGWESVPQEHPARHKFPLPVFLQRQAEQWRACLAALAETATA